MYAVALHHNAVTPHPSYKDFILVSCDWSLNEDIVAWCDEHMPGRWRLHPNRWTEHEDAPRHIAMLFVDERDAVLFKLQWGDMTS